MTMYKFNGTKGQHIPGVPARDLTETEFDMLSQQLRAAVKFSGLYVKVVQQDNVQSIDQPIAVSTESEPEQIVELIENPVVEETIMPEAEIDMEYTFDVGPSLTSSKRKRS